MFDCFESLRTFSFVLYTWRRSEATLPRHDTNRLVSLSLLLHLVHRQTPHVCLQWNMCSSRESSMEAYCTVLSSVRMHCHHAHPRIYDPDEPFVRGNYVLDFLIAGFQRMRDRSSSEVEMNSINSFSVVSPWTIRAVRQVGRRTGYLGGTSRRHVD